MVHVKLLNDIGPFMDSFFKVALCIEVNDKLFLFV